MYPDTSDGEKKETLFVKLCILSCGIRARSPSGEVGFRSC